MVEYIPIQGLLKQKNKKLMISLSFVIYCCGDLLEDMLRYIGISVSGAHIIISLILAFCLLYDYSVLYHGSGRKATVWPIYFFCVSFMLFTWLIHPEYSSWYTHLEYGIGQQFVPLYRGFYGLLFISLFSDAGHLLSSLTAATRLNFLYYILKYMRARRLGYWIVHRVDGSISYAAYSLNYGYNVIFCAILFFGLYIYRRKLYDLAIAIISTVLSLTAGSRGALICLFVAGVLYTLYRWDEMRSNNVKFIVILVVLILALVLSSIGFDTILNVAIGLLSRTGISGRTIQMLTTGKALNDSGRDNIYNRAFEMIRNGGLLGYGFYGDRYGLGTTNYFGYPHNIFLEFIIELGMPLGVILIGIILYNIVRMGLKCKNATWRLLFVIFFSSSIKLVLSDSFWYYWPFWGLLGIIKIWNLTSKQRRRLLRSR